MIKITRLKKEGKGTAGSLNIPPSNLSDVFSILAPRISEKVRVTEERILEKILMEFSRTSRNRLPW